MRNTMMLPLLTVHVIVSGLLGAHLVRIEPDVSAPMLVLTVLLVSIVLWCVERAACEVIRSIRAGEWED